MTHQDPVRVDRHEVNRKKSLFRQTTRRAFLGKVGLFTASTAIAGTLSPAVLKTKEGGAEAQVIASYAGEGFPPKRVFEKVGVVAVYANRFTISRIIAR